MCYFILSQYDLLIIINNLIYCEIYIHIYIYILKCFMLNKYYYLHLVIIIII